MNSSLQIYNTDRQHSAWVIHICEYTVNLIIQYNTHSLIYMLQFGPFIGLQQQQLIKAHSALLARLINGY